MHVDMVDFVFRNYLDSEWSNKELNELSEKIQNLDPQRTWYLVLMSQPKWELRNDMR